MTLPFAVDTYLPALPELGEELTASDPLVQFAMSAFMIGMAIGQVIIGPISDSLGRYKLLLISAIFAVLGGILTEPIGWRGIMWLIVGLTVIQLVLSVVVLGETLPPEKRSSGGLKSFGANLRSVFSRPPFVWYVLASGLTTAAFFSYISGSAFVFQGQLGLSVGQYTFMFASLSVAMGVMSGWNTRLISVYSPEDITRNVLFVQLLGAAVVVLAGVVFQNFWVVLVGTLLVVVPNSINMANLTTLGTRAAGERAGTGQAMLGAAQFALGGLISPLVGMGENQVLAMGAVMIVCTAAGFLCLEMGVRAEKQS